MSEGKTRFKDIGSISAGLPLKGFGLRPKGTVIDPSTQAVTAVGRQAEAAQKSLVAQIDELKAERTTGMVLLRLDPKTIKPTKFANRDARGLTIKDPAFATLKESIRTNGQDTPIRVRPGKGGEGKDYEVVEGHRRLAAIVELDAETDGGFLILARIDAKAAETKDLVLKMYRENEERADLSAFEKGSMFKQWLAEGVYESQREIVAATGLSETRVSQCLTIANLPAEVLAAFGDERQISLRWSPALAKALKEQSAETVSRARRLAKLSPRPDAESVYKALTAAAALPRKDRGSKSESVKVNNKTLFTASLRGGRISMTPKQLPPERHAAAYEFLKASFQQWLDDDGGSGQ